MKENEQFVNEDTYQTLTELKTGPQPDELARTPLWKDKSEENKPKKPYSIFRDKFLFYIFTPFNLDSQR